ncbi:outer membrane protein with beta-barrel domain [Aquimarina sp. MAR_2010_214]|uniref:outer membrane beta-barrel protein n=1 Tax=Aquimarina sp. MAR_2010_214 TaxID=1250026 RepID=UPI000C6FDDB0|nr:outer membrane beta-barrel protein [Aquimarina sp. MAR_2010_214]PKV48957.1 outer membrane protein with beta-barrel domain [Aquimarina sp. MAR_2010_214]
MKDKKNIDRLFQEKFKDFEVIPDEIVWEKIKARQNKNKKRVFLIPFWYRVAGVAALITLIFGISFLPLNNNVQQQNNTITDSDTQHIIEQKKTAPDKKTNPPKENVIVTSEEKETNPVDQKTKSTNPDQDNDAGQHNYFEPSVTKENAVAKTLKQVPSQPKNGSELDPASHSGTKNRIVNHTTTNNSRTAQTPFKQKEDPIITQENTIEKTTIANQQNKKSTPEKEHPLFTTPKEKDNTNTQGLAEKSNDNDIKNKIPEEDVENLDDNGKKSIFDVINKEEEEEIAEESTSTKKWNVAPNVAPVYYSSIGNGSSIDSQFADNNKNGQVNMSYGVHVSYAINKRFSVRSGVNKVDLSYNTEGVGFSPSAVGQNLENVNYNSTAGAILISDIGNVRNTDIGAEFSDINRNAINQKQNAGLLNQSIAYLEVPLEMKYALVDKKIGVNMIGGISTLFLQDNEISIEAGDFETPIGEASNLNDVSFSGNIGLGVDYKISDQFEINLEPIFKYQFNAFNDNANNFKPYYFGVYTGVSIKF